MGGDISTTAMRSHKLMRCGCFVEMPVYRVIISSKLKMLRKIFKIAAGFASVGFVIPWLLLGFYAIADRVDAHPNTTLLFYLCPSSIAALGLDNASFLVGLLGWLGISVSNAFLYAIPGAIVGAVVSAIWRPEPEPPFTSLTFR
jgi:hypothetical protein